jgi:hypothetical protein
VPLEWDRPKQSYGAECAVCNEKAEASVLPHPVGHVGVRVLVLAGRPEDPGERVDDQHVGRDQRLRPHPHQLLVGVDRREVEVGQVREPLPGPEGIHDRLHPRRCSWRKPRSGSSTTGAQTF